MLMKKIIMCLIICFILPSTGYSEKVKSYSYSLCCKCGEGLNSETTTKGTTKEIELNSVSKWIKKYIKKDCDHDWIPVSGWSSTDNKYWNNKSIWHATLSCICKLSAKSKETETKERLDRYFKILKEKDKKKQTKELMPFFKELRKKMIKLRI